MFKIFSRKKNTDQFLLGEHSTNSLFFITFFGSNCIKTFFFEKRGRYWKRRMSRENLSIISPQSNLSSRKVVLFWKSWGGQKKPGEDVSNKCCWIFISFPVSIHSKYKFLFLLFLSLFYFILLIFLNLVRISISRMKLFIFKLTWVKMFPSFSRGRRMIYPPPPVYFTRRMCVL